MTTRAIFDCLALGDGGVVCRCRMALLASKRIPLRVRIEPVAGTFIVARVALVIPRRMGVGE